MKIKVGVGQCSICEDVKTFSEYLIDLSQDTLLCPRCIKSARRLISEFEVNGTTELNKPVHKDKNI